MPKKSDNHTNDNDSLPVTEEVGGEGGSYADAVVQSETFEGDLPKVDDTTKQEPPGRVAGAVPENPQDAEDGIRFPKIKS